MIKTLGERKIVYIFHDVAKTWECRTEIIFCMLQIQGQLIAIGKQRNGKTQVYMYHLFVGIFRRIQSAVQQVTRINHKIIM